MAVPSSVRRSFWSGLVTLTSANTNYNILALVNAALAVQTGNSSVIVPGSVKELLLQADPGIDGVGGNTKDILVGDANLSTTNYGFVLSKSSSAPFRSDQNNVGWSWLYVQSAGASQKLGVTLFEA